MSDASITVDLRGPILTGGAGPLLGQGVDEGLAEIGERGRDLVRDQLAPGHGVRTGTLRDTIWGGLVSHLHAQVDAGLQQQGANLPYAEDLEGGTRPHLIVPRTGRALRWQGPNGVRFARRVHHPGTKGLHMFANARRALASLDLGQIIVEKILKRLGQ